MNILDLVGNTPLLELKKISQDMSGVTLFVKAEFCNPSGSVKDRAAKGMILEGLETGKLVPGKTIIDATSGNTGIAYAMIGAALGYPVTIYLPANASSERKRILRNYGAEIVETSPLESSDGAFLAAKEAAAKDPERYFFPNQYNNDANWRAHYNSTGSEIWEQTGGRVTHFITGLGTSGTFMGTSRRLKDYNKDIRVYAVQPDSPFHGIEGTKHMGSTIKPGIYDEKMPQGIVEVNTEAAYAMTRRLAREEGIFVGISSGANVVGAVQLGRTLPKGSVVVTILGDSGSRYISDSFWEAGE
ncbi:cysteine synthase B (O-acetylserine sulfhydrylase B) (O-acetylserine (Thiol)-lyase B) (CSase B) [Treponema primitia ZAS-2]|uniref:cysteine synthase n=1 Tax=Treponema primitia (strain ATCC BAA-887 / DSM 12427 / ZAS-2) TaxID=545694 RepID=F5YQC6_TREPZ|nr:PLP-dependent cysteine synthase family protein [Treponema primitia]AEF86311.1 cysteine synthase B (O-acetylserine sulfhydrylase B) (O-acetylserine (Thiol)-lyase B) (CSase B) [Treponema primitia ZAS-2]